MSIDDVDPFAPGAMIPGTPPAGAVPAEPTDPAKEPAKRTRTRKAKEPAATEEQPATPAEPAEPVKPAKPDYTERVWAQFFESEDMPAHGIPVSVNGTAYLIKPGRPVNVPRFVLRAIDNAIAERPIQDASGGKIRGYRKVQRFTYTLIGNPEE